MLSQINMRSRAVSQTHNGNQKQFDHFNDTIPTCNYQYDQDKDSQIKSAINTVFIQLSTKNGGKNGGVDMNARPSYFNEDQSNNLTINANVNKRIQTLDW